MFTDPRALPLSRTPFAAWGMPRDAMRASQSLPAVPDLRWWKTRACRQIQMVHHSRHGCVLSLLGIPRASANDEAHCVYRASVAPRGAPVEAYAAPAELISCHDTLAAAVAAGSGGKIRLPGTASARDVVVAASTPIAGASDTIIGLETFDSGFRGRNIVWSLRGDTGCLLNGDRPVAGYPLGIDDQINSAIPLGGCTSWRHFAESGVRGDQIEISPALPDLLHMNDRTTSSMWSDDGPSYIWAIEQFDELFSVMRNVFSAPEGGDVLGLPVGPAQLTGDPIIESPLGVGGALTESYPVTPGTVTGGVLSDNVQRTLFGANDSGVPSSDAYVVEYVWHDRFGTYTTMRRGYHKGGHKGFGRRHQEGNGYPRYLFEQTVRVGSRYPESQGSRVKYMKCYWVFGAGEMTFLVQADSRELSDGHPFGVITGYWVPGNQE